MKKLLKNNKSGSILLLALLVMSGSLVTGLTIGTIVINEIRQSRNLDQAIIAYHQASSGAEQAVYYFRKDNSNFDSVVGTTSGSCNFDTSGSYQILGSCDYYYEQAQTQALSLTKGEVKQINLFDENLNPAGFGVDSIEIDWYDQNPGNLQEPWLEVLIYEIVNDWDSVPRETANLVKKCSTEVTSPYPSTIPPDQAGNTESYCGKWTEDTYIDTSQNYKIRFRSLYDNVRLFVTARDNGGGVVDMEQTHIYTNGGYLDANQAVKVEISDIDSSKSISDYVLFSDCDLTKGANAGSICP